MGDDVPADYDALSAVLDVAVERLRRGWGAVGHLQSVVDTPALRAAYTENLPRVTEFMTRLGADERLYAKYKAVAASPAAARLSPAKRKALADALRDFVLGGAELQGAARERFAQLQDRMAAAVAAVRRARARRHRRLRALRRHRRTRRRARRRAGGHARRGRSRGPARPQADAACPGLPAGAAVRDQPCAARAAVPRPRHACQRVRPARARQQRADARAGRTAPGRGRAARPRQLRPGVAGGEDGRVARAGAGLRARPARSARARTPNATWPSWRTSPPASWACSTCSPGTAPSPANDSSRRGSPSAATRSSSTSPSRVCCTACSAWSRRCSTSASAPARLRSGTTACATSTSNAAASRWPASTSTCTRAPARAAAPGWTKCVRAGSAPTAAGCSCRWRTWSATSRRRSATSPHC